MKIDTEQLNNIPIADVAKHLGIDLSNKKVIMCFKGHGKKTPSLSFELNKNFFNCFSCGIAGGPINLVKEYYSIGFVESCKWLTERFIDTKTSVPIEFENSSYEEKVIEDDNIYKKDSEIYEWLIQNSSLSNEVISYFKSRGITESTLKHFQIKDISNPYLLLNEAKKIWGIERLLKCGLWKYKDGKQKPTWWHHVIIFPFFDINNRITYIQGRFLNHEYRWMNLSKVKSTIFNEKVLKDLQAFDNIVITEGLPDTLSLHQRGIKSVGIMGASNFKEEYVELLKDYEILVAPDNDPAGDMFYKKIEQLFMPHKSIRKVTIPREFNDVNDALKGKSNG